MTLTHTQQSDYIRLDDVYTDDDGVEYTVYQDTDAKNPRTWLTPITTPSMVSMPIALKGRVHRQLSAHATSAHAFLTLTKGGSFYEADHLQTRSFPILGY